MSRLSLVGVVGMLSLLSRTAGADQHLRYSGNINDPTGELRDPITNALLAAITMDVHICDPGPVDDRVNPREFGEVHR